MEADCTHHPLYQAHMPPNLTWVRCEDCDHVFTKWMWSSEALDEIFSYTQDAQKPGYEMEGGRLISSEIVEKVIASGVGSGRWLDVGFGNGSLLFTALEYGFSVVGLDLRASTVDVMGSIGIEAFRKDIADFTSEKLFDVISFADCLEHIPYPKQALSASRRLLAPDGRIFLSMPNAGAPLWGFLTQTDANPYWAEFEHYHNFSRDRLYDLLKEEGFEPISYGVSKRYRCCMEVIARPLV